MCPPCFAKGKESSPHLNSHCYRVISDDFCLFDDWTAQEELMLLEQLDTHGPSYWSEVAKKLKHGPSECEEHYNRFYLEDPVEPLPRPPSPEQLYRPAPYPHIVGSHDPPRPKPDTSFLRDLAGYNAARGDFQVEAFNSAEFDVASIQDENWLVLPEVSIDEEEQDQEDIELSKALVVAVVEIYNNKLRERTRRKRIIQEHGLINYHRHLAARYRYDMLLTTRVTSQLSPFAQLVKGRAFCQLFEGLYAHAELRQRIQQLQKYRHLGLQSKAAVQLYNQLSANREKRLKQMKQFATNVNAALPANPTVLSASLAGNLLAAQAGHLPQQRRSAPPLDIVGLPGYDKLNDGERQLCSVSRLVPESYIEFRNILIAECRKSNGIRLAQARTLIKIDVNKTRKIFDYLLEEKLIYLPS